MDWLRRSATEQGRAIMAGLLSPIELVETYLHAIAGHPYGGRIYAHVTADRARAEATAAHDRARAGLRRGLLDGIAISWKDNIDSAGIQTEAGSKLLLGRIPLTDAAVLAHATAQGLACLGKTHMTELAFSGLGLNPVTATPPNTFDAALAPGGSSSGAAVSVAAGLAAAAVGTDTGGSIRLPAAWNGLVGFKPSHGAVPARGVVPLCPRFDCIGPIARNVQDCAELFAMLRGEQAMELAPPERHGGRPLRLLLIEGLPLDTIRELPREGFFAAVARLERRGARIDRCDPPMLRDAMDLAPVIFAPEAYGIWRDQIEDAPDLMYPPILTRFRSGAGVPACDYVAAWALLEQLRREWARMIAGYDAAIMPTSPILPPDRESLLADADLFASENMLSLRNTRIANFMGAPAITLPTSRIACGFMMIGQAGRDRNLLAAAARAEGILTT